MEKLENDHLQHLRLTNAAPTPQDKALIYIIISDIDKEVLQVDESITILERELQKLKSTRAAHIQRRSVYTNVLSPIRLLPPEILGEIFMCASERSLSARVRVSHVCQLWRSAALGTSELWLTIRGPSGHKLEVERDYFQACVSRAQSRPLILDYHTIRKPMPYDGLSFIEAAVATPSCRWQECSWISPWVTFFKPLIDLLASRSRDTLETLSLESRRNHSQVPLSALNSISKSGFKHLSSLSLTLVFEPLDHVVFDVPWPQLKRLSLSFREAAEDTLFEIFRNCSEIEECVISLQDFHQSLHHPDRLRPIRLAKLRKLQLYNSEDLFSGLTGVLVTPVLEDLKLDISEETVQSTTTHPDIYRFLLTNAENLRRLWIYGIPENRIGDNIIHLRFLEELTLALVRVVDRAAFHALSVRYLPFSDSINYIPLPHLRSLQILSQIDDDTQVYFINLVESRWWPFSNDENSLPRPYACLKHASLQDIYGGNTFQSQILTEVANFRREGLDLRMPA